MTKSGRAWAKKLADRDSDKPGRRSLAKIIAANNATELNKAHDALIKEAIKWAWKLYGVRLYKTESKCVMFRDSNGSVQFRRSGICNGWLDITGVLPPTGRALFVDCKLGKQTEEKRSGLNKDQAKFRDDMMLSGAAVLILSDLSQFLADLSQLLDIEKGRGQTI